MLDSSFDSSTTTRWRAISWIRIMRVLLILFLFITGTILVEQCEFHESLLTLCIVDLVLMGMTLFGVLFGLLW